MTLNDFAGLILFNSQKINDEIFTKFSDIIYLKHAVTNNRPIMVHEESRI